MNSKAVSNVVHWLSITIRILSACMISYMRMSSKWKSQHRCHIILEILTGRQFMSVRPYWLKNPETGRNLELDCYNEEYRLALEYNGVQHYNGKI
jgi:hypothetical protein